MLVHPGPFHDSDEENRGTKKRKLEARSLAKEAHRTASAGDDLAPGNVFSPATRQARRYAVSEC